MALHDDDPAAERPDRDATLNVSRRVFLKTVSASSVAAGVIAPGESDAQTGPAAIGPGEVPIQLTVDGQARTLKVEPRLTLLDALRERLDVTAQKRVCDRGQLRRLHRAHRRAQRLRVLGVRHRRAGPRDTDRREPGTGHGPASGAAGVLRARRAHVRVLHAGLRHGRCRAAREEPVTDSGAGPEALDGNICRCGTYPRVLDAVLNTKGVRRA